jgi:hypothetical protein
MSELDCDFDCVDHGNEQVFSRGFINESNLFTKTIFRRRQKFHQNRSSPLLRTMVTFISALLRYSRYDMNLSEIRIHFYLRNVKMHESLSEIKFIKLMKDKLNAHFKD